MDFDRAEAREFIDEILNFVEFETFLDNACEKNWENFANSLGCCGNFIKWGATKGVVIFDNYVLKFPFVDEYINHCEREEKIYNGAIEENLEDFFCSIELFMDIDGYPIYVQPRVEVDENWAEEKSHDYLISDEVEEQEGWDMFSCEFSYEEQMIGLFLSDGLDRSIAYRLEEFFEEWEISDLHFGNVGYDDEGNWKLIDYAGFITV